MSDTKKLPGLLQDPWRHGIPEKTEEVPAPKPVGALTKAASASPIDDDLKPSMRYATIELKGYGGITVDGVSEVNQASAQLLRFCVDYEKEIGPTLAEFGVLVAQVPVEELSLDFYIQRDDGWLIAVPDATSRDAGCLQLIQALSSVKSDPKMRAAMAKYHLRPYKT